MVLYINSYIIDYEATTISFDSKDIDNVINFLELTPIIKDFGFDGYFITNQSVK